MNLKLKILAAAVVMAVSGAAHAAISTDNFAGGSTLGSGTGVGELFLSIYDPGRSLSMVLDLNLTANSFRNNNAALINTFSVTDATLQSFIAGSSNQSLMRWNLGALSNAGFGPNNGALSTHGNAGATIDANEAVYDGNALTIGMANLEAYVNQHPTTMVVASSGGPAGHTGSYWGGTMGGALRYDNQHIGFAGGELMSFMALGQTDVSDLGGAPYITAFSGGQWVLDPTLGRVSYVSAVPIPAAVWLFGSGLIGLVGISRRKKQA